MDAVSVKIVDQATKRIEQIQERQNDQNRMKISVKQEEMLHKCYPEPAKYREVTEDLPTFQQITEQAGERVC